MGDICLYSCSSIKRIAKARRQIKNIVFCNIVIVFIHIIRQTERGSLTNQLRHLVFEFFFPDPFIELYPETPLERNK